MQASCGPLLDPSVPPLALSLLPSLSLSHNLTTTVTATAPCQYQPRLFGYAATGGAAGPPGASPTSDADWDANVGPGGTTTSGGSGGGRGQLRRAVGVPVPSGASTPRGGAMSDVPLVPLSKAGARGGDAPRQALLPPGQGNSSGKGVSGRGTAAASAAVAGAEEEGWTGEVGGTFRPDTFAFTMDNPLPPAGTSGGRGVAAYAPPPPPPYPGAGAAAAGSQSSGARRPAADPFASPDPFGTASPVSPSASASAAAGAGAGAGADSNNWDWMDRDSALPSAPGAPGSGAGGPPSGGRSGNKRFAGSDEGLI